MNKTRVTYLALGALFSAISCTTEMAEPDVCEWSDGNIYFRTFLNDVATSRAADMTLDRLESFQVTCFNTGDLKKDAEGNILPYFEEATFVRQNSPVGIAYVSSPAEGPRYWPEKSGLLKFFAFSPSRTVMASGNPDLTDTDKSKYFHLINNSTEANSTVAVGYSLGPVRINRDISRQFDFMTAVVSGDRWKDFGGGVNLDFSHQMSQVELKAWGSGIGYNFEIAGVRLGNPVVEGTFVFSDTASPDFSSGWAKTEDAIRDKVEYLYCGAHTAGDGEIPVAGDKIFHIKRNEHNTPESAASIMGCGGCAMVLPTVNSKWEGTADPNIGVKPYATRRMYFSVLLRVIDPVSGRQLYPYPDNPDNMTVVYYAVDKSGAIVTRLYPGQKKDEFFTDRALQHPYVAAEGEVQKEFGWAAVPVDADWSAGKRYIYTLNYSDGIGLHDPQDPDPGKPIVMNAPVSWGVAVDSWKDAEKSEDFDPDVNVP